MLKILIQNKNLQNKRIIIILYLKENVIILQIM